MPLMLLPMFCRRRILSFLLHQTASFSSSCLLHTQHQTLNITHSTARAQHQHTLNITHSSQLWLRKLKITFPTSTQSWLSLSWNSPPDQFWHIFHVRVCMKFSMLSYCFSFSISSSKVHLIKRSEDECWLIHGLHFSSKSSPPKKVSK